MSYYIHILYRMTDNLTDQKNSILDTHFDKENIHQKLQHSRFPHSISRTDGRADMYGHPLIKIVINNHKIIKCIIQQIHIY